MSNSPLPRISDVLVTLSRDAWRLAHSQEAFTPLEYLTSHFSQEFILTGAVRTERIRVGIALLAHRKILKLRAVLARQLAVRIGALGDRVMTSMRKPSTPRSSHQFIMSYTARRTAGFSQLRSGCFFEN